METSLFGGNISLLICGEKMDIASYITAILIGFIALAWSADRFIAGASNIARGFNISPLIIGITVVGFGTSAPEILVSAMASLQNTPGIAIGNAIGSNITNIALVIGLTALIIPVSVRPQIIKREMPILFAIMAICFIFFFDKDLTRTEGIIFLILQVAVLIWAVHISRKEKDHSAEELADDQAKMSVSKAIFWLILGLAVLLASSKLLVWGAVSIAKLLEVPELIIGLTIVALGTSLPELAASITSVRKNHPDIAIGNILGSNIFNILSVLGIAAVLSPTSIEDKVLSRDFAIMTGLTILLLLFSYRFGKKSGTIGRFEGFTLLCAYCGYQILLFLSVSG